LLFIIHVLESSKPKGVAIIIPGLSGGSSTLYVMSLITAAHKNNYDAVVINFKTQGGIKITVRLKSFHQ